jgi:hypothetical protein
MDTITSIRCPNERPHGQYNLCGHLLGALYEDEIYVYCSNCKIFHKITIRDNNTIEMSSLPQKIRLDLKTTLRLVS